MSDDLPLPGPLDTSDSRYLVLNDAQGQSLLVERSGWGGSAELAMMASDEYLIWRRVEHPNVLRLVGTRESDEGVFCYHEHAPSWQLSTLLARARKRGKSVPVGVAVAIFAEVLAGLQSIHMTCGDAGEFLGMVHRKIDPDHILVGTDGVAKILLPGLSRFEDNPGCRGPGAIVHQRFRYMSPEQVRGLPLDSRADLYTVAVGFWEMLTGQIFLKSSSDIEVLEKIIAGKFEPPAALTPDISPALDAALMKALSLSPDDRFPQAASLLKALISSSPPASVREVIAWARELGCREFPYEPQDREEHQAPAPGPAPQADEDDAPTEGSPYRGRRAPPEPPSTELDASPDRRPLIVAGLAIIVFLLVLRLFL